MELRDRGALLDVGLVALGGGALGGVVDTVPLIAGMVVLVVARTVVGRLQARAGNGLLSPAAVPAAAAGAGGGRRRRTWAFVARGTRRGWRGRDPEFVDLDAIPELVVAREPDEDPNLAVIDALTGLPNRRGVERALDAECRKAARRNGAIAVLVFAVRDAEHIRRMYGPQAARDVCRATGERLRRAIGDSGTVGRWGGEEFVVVVPGLRPQAAPLLAERFRRVMEAEPFRLSSGRRVPVAIGAGWAATPRDGISAQFLVARAQSRAVARAGEARVLALR